MNFVSLSLGSVARAAVILLAVAASMAPEPGFAAPPRGPDFRFGNGSRLHFNIDPGPCAMGQQFPRGRRGDCPGPSPRQLRRGGNGPRGPGPNAFGLQFDDGY